MFTVAKPENNVAASLARLTGKDKKGRGAALKSSSQALKAQPKVSKTPASRFVTSTNLSCGLPHLTLRETDTKTHLHRQRHPHT